MRGALLFILLLPSICSAQFSKDRQIDSLKATISNLAVHDTTRATAYVELSNKLYASNPDTVITLCLKAIQIAEQHIEDEATITSVKESFSSSLAVAFNNIGYMYNSKGDISTGLEYYLKSLRIKKEAGNFQGMAASLINIGRTYENLGDIEKALEYYHKGLKIYENLKYLEGVAIALNNIGSIYDDQGDHTKGLEFYFKSLRIKEALGNRKGVALSLNNIGHLYRGQGDIEKGLEYYKKSLKIKEEISDPKGVSKTLNNIGRVYRSQGDRATALDYYQQSLKIKEEIGYKKGMATSFNNIGHIYLELGNTQQAMEYAKKSLKLAEELGYPSDIREAANLLSLISRKVGNYRSALEMYERYIHMRDSITNEQTQKASIRHQARYEFEKKQLIKEQKEKEQTRIESTVTLRRDNMQYSVIFISMLFLFGGVLSLGFINVSERMAEGLIFFSFLIFFEFILVLADPYIEVWSSGAPGIKLLFNAGIAALIFPLHSFFETKIKLRIAQ